MRVGSPMEGEARRREGGRKHGARAAQSMGRGAAATAATAPSSPQNQQPNTHLPVRELGASLGDLVERAAVLAVRPLDAPEAVGGLEGRIPEAGDVFHPDSVRWNDMGGVSEAAGPQGGRGSRRRGGRESSAEKGCDKT